MKALPQLFALAALALAMTGCATSGPRFSELKSSTPPLAADQGRIYVYRTAVMGAAVQPSVQVNGEKVGSAVPKGFFYLDRPPGNYEITTTTEVKRSLSLTLDPGQTRFVRLGISMGFFIGHVFPELVDNGSGEREIEKCHFTGARPAAAKTSGQE